MHTHTLAKSVISLREPYVGEGGKKCVPLFFFASLLNYFPPSLLYFNAAFCL